MFFFSKNIFPGHFKIFQKTLSFFWEILNAPTFPILSDKKQFGNLRKIFFSPEMLIPIDNLILVDRMI